MRYLLFGFLCLLMAKKAFGQQPHILFITIDDLNDYTESLGGQPQVETPTLQALSAQGTTFINAYASGPLCGPSRVSLITGKDLDYTQVYNNGDVRCSNFRKMFDADFGNETVYTIPEWLKDSLGYFTYSFNKVLHCPESPGDFDTVTADMCSKERSWNQVYYYDDASITEPAGDAILGGPTTFRWAKLSDTLEPYMEDHKMIDTVIAFLNAYGADPSLACDRPLFLGIGFSKPHTPWLIPEQYFNDLYVDDFQAYPYKIPYNDPVTRLPWNGLVMPPQPEVPYSDYDALDPDGVAESFVDPGTFLDILEFADSIIPEPIIDPTLSDAERMAVLQQSLYANAVMAYMAAIKFADAQLGRLIDYLETVPAFYNNTILVICSDNGFGLGEKKHIMKGALWETDTRVPLTIIDMRNPIPGTVQQTVSLVDLFPTICDMIDGALPTFPDGAAYVDGISLKPFLENNALQYARPVLTSYIEPIEGDQGACFPSYSVRDQRFHYICYRTNNVYGEFSCDFANSIIEEELYDIGVNRETDPNEWNNLIDSAGFEPVVHYLQQYLPDSSLYMQQAWKAEIKLNSPECLLANTDTAFFSITWYGPDGLPAVLPDDVQCKWSFDILDTIFTDTSVALPMSIIDPDIFLEKEKLIVYLELFDSIGQLRGFDTRYVHFDPAKIPKLFFDLTPAFEYTVEVSDFNIGCCYNTYWWDIGSGPVSFNEVPAIIDFEEPGEHMVTLYAQYGNDPDCITSLLRLHVTGVPVTDLQFESAYVFPNPAVNVLNFYANSPILEGEVHMYDILGASVLTHSISKNSDNMITVDVSRLPPGLYIMDYRGLSGSFNTTFVKL